MFIMGNIGAEYGHLNEDHYFCDCGYAVSVLDALNRVVKLESCYIPSTKEVMCGECNNKYEKIIQIEKFKCPKCRVLMEEVRIEDKFATGGDLACGTLQIMGTPYKVAIHSDSLAISPDQVAEHKREFPNIEIDDQCRPVFTHKKTHQEYMDKCGVRKQAQKTSRGKNKIYSYPGSKCS